MRVLTTIDDLKHSVGGLFVPTMGALHEGHLALIRHADLFRKARARRAPIVVSIFVNPTQFNDPGDLSRYPRTLDRDLNACRAAGADAVFVPTQELIYPPGVDVPVPPLPQVATTPGLEDALRPGHFAGVCQVVARLFELVRPVAAFFGEKDWQQFVVISEMVRSGVPRGLPVEIVPVATVRDADGLALSSRNVFLTPDQRHAALAIFRALSLARTVETPDGAERRMQRVLLDARLTIQYAVVRCARTLMPLDNRDGGPDYGARALIAVQLPNLRLIDNAGWP